MRNLIILAFLLLILTITAAGCANPAPPDTGLGPRGEVDADSEIADDQAADENEEGIDWGSVTEEQWANTPASTQLLDAFSIATGIEETFEASVPDGWPDDIPVMEGFTIQSGYIMTYGALSVYATGNESAEKVVAFYTDPENMPGWDVATETSWTDYDGVDMRQYVLRKTNDYLTIQIRPKDEGLGLTLSIGGETRFKGNAPVGWPEEIKIMEGFGIDYGTIKLDGNLSVDAIGDASAEEIDVFYHNPTNMPGWEEISRSWDVIPRHSFVLMKGNEIILILADPVMSIPRTTSTRLTLHYATTESGNDFRIPVETYKGSLPDGWPENIPVMSRFVIQYGCLMPDGALVVNARGDIPVDDVEAFYTGLPGWEEVSLTNYDSQFDVVWRSLYLQSESSEIWVSIVRTGDVIDLQLRYLAAE